MSEEGLTLQKAVKAAMNGAELEDPAGWGHCGWDGDKFVLRCSGKALAINSLRLHGWRVVKPAPEPEPEFEDCPQEHHSTAARGIQVRYRCRWESHGRYVGEIETDHRFEHWGFKRADGSVYLCGRHIQYIDEHGSYWDHPGAGRKRVFANFARMRVCKKGDC